MAATLKKTIPILGAALSLTGCPQNLSGDPVGTTVSDFCENMVSCEKFVDVDSCIRFFEPRDLVEEYSLDCYYAFIDVMDCYSTLACGDMGDGLSEGTHPSEQCAAIINEANILCAPPG